MESHYLMSQTSMWTDRRFWIIVQQLLFNIAVTVACFVIFGIAGLGMAIIIAIYSEIVVRKTFDKENQRARHERTKLRKGDS